MPVTPVHGKKASFSLDSNDVSGWFNEIDFPETIDTAETTTFQPTGDAKTYVVGLKSYTISLTGLWDATIDGYLASIDSGGVAVDFIYGPQGATTGNVKYSGSAIMTKNNPKSALNAATTLSVELQITGEVTRGTYS